MSSRVVRWAIVLAVSSWPVYGRLLKWTGHRSTLASFLMLLGMILIILLPLVAAMLMAAHFWRIRKDGGLSHPSENEQVVAPEKGAAQ